MLVLKMRDIKQLSTPELRKTVLDLKKEQMRLRFSLVLDKNPQLHLFKIYRCMLARCKTVLSLRR